mgnify:CR=1 FL=1
MPILRALPKPLLRGLLTLALLASLAHAATSAWRLATSPAAAMLQPVAAQQVGATWERTLARAATPEALARRLDERLAETPRNWIAIAALEELAAAQGVTLPDATRAERDRLHALDHGWGRAAASCAACALDLSDCPLSVGPLSCGLTVQITALGDVVSLGREAANYLAGRDVDGVDVALSVIGLGAAGMVVATRGPGIGVKTGAAFLKTAHAMGRLHPELVGVFRRAAREGIDWAGLRNARALDDLGRLQNQEMLRPAIDAAESFGRLVETVGPYQSLSLANRLDSVAEARQVARASEVLGARTPGALELLGKSRFLRVGLRWSDEFRHLLAGLLGALAALVGLFWSTLSGLVLRRARRLASG